MNLKPLGDRVVLKQLVAEETTKSGIVLPGQNKEKPQQAEVVAVGRNGVVAVTFGKNRLGVIPADLRSGQHIEPMYFVESMSIGEMSP